MTRAEEAALKAYPFIPLPQYDLRDENPTDGNKIHRRIFLEGYEQAEKDVISTIEYRLSELLGDAQPTPVLRLELQDLIKQIKEEE